MIWHGFLDTNSLWASEEKRARVASLASASPNTLLYVPDLVREERLTNQIDKAQRRHAKRLPDEDRDKIRKEVDTEVSSLDASVFPCRIPNPELAASVALSLIRRGTDLKFRDGVILLSSLSFAFEHNVRACVFVTNDTELLAVATALAEPYGIRVLCVEDLDGLARVLESGFEKVQAFTAYVEAHRDYVITLVEEVKPQAIEKLVRSAQQEYGKVERAELEAGEWSVRVPLQAIPLHPPVDGQEWVGEVRLSMDLHVPGYLHMTVTFRGTVLVPYEGGRFTGEPRGRDFSVASVSV